MVFSGDNIWKYENISRSMLVAYTFTHERRNHMKKYTKAIATLTSTLVLSASLIAPASAAEINSAPKAEFQSIWNTVQKMIGDKKTETTSTTTPETKPETTPAPEQKPTPAPAPEAKPTPAPTTKPTPAPETKPAPAPTTPSTTPSTTTKDDAGTTKDDTGYQISAFEKRVVELVNIERGKEGLKPLAADPLLGKGARAKSQDMVDNNYFSHTSPKYGSPFAMMKTFGVKYAAAGENIASGQASPESVVKSWMNSPGHRANIMSTKYGKIGVGYAYKSGGNYHHYWTQWFTN